MNNFNKKLFAAVSSQVIILLVIILFKLLILGTGTEIVLKIAPVDPRSPLRGDYMTFRYDISDLPSYYFEQSSLANGTKMFFNDATVYVSLRQTRNYWIAERASFKKPSDGVFIKGKIVNAGSVAQNLTGVFNSSPESVEVVYGIEQYFIREGAGRNFSLIGKDASAVVKVDSNGNAVITGLIIDGVRWP